MVRQDLKCSMSGCDGLLVVLQARDVVNVEYVDGLHLHMEFDLDGPLDVVSEDPDYSGSSASVLIDTDENLGVGGLPGVGHRQDVLHQLGLFFLGGPLEWGPRPLEIERIPLGQSEQRLDRNLAHGDYPRRTGCRRGLSGLPTLCRPLCKTLCSLHKQKPR